MSTPPLPDLSAEWLEADGLGGFASGTVGGTRTRRYHALLLSATRPPTGRCVLVNGLDAHVVTEAGRYALSSQRYAPDVTSPDGARRLTGFASDPWPRWSWRLEDDSVVEQELFVPRGLPLVVLSFRLLGPPRPATLELRPFLSGRDYHALHHENADFGFMPTVTGDSVTWRPYASVPAVTALANGGYLHEAHWYRRFLYAEEEARGLDHVEDLASPGLFRFDLERREAVLLLAAEGEAADALRAAPDAESLIAKLRAEERARRAALGTRLDRAAEAYVVRRGAGRTIVAGYPWFTDWGRDTFIALRGLCFARGRFEVAREILLEWAGAVSEGMLPNRFPDGPDEAPEYNSVDASLWYVVAVGEFLRGGSQLAKRERRALERAVLAILEGYAAGTRHGIRADDDGLLAAGEPGVQLTWMDARIGDWVVTPRIGKPVEVQALWANALAVGARFDPAWSGPLDRVRAAFAARFWNADRGILHDVVDVDHVAGRVDASLRPNQILAVGGLPLALLEGERARAVVDAVEERLLTPLGLRSLEPGAGYAPRYAGGPRERDAVYHQGTVWPWLLGPFVEAWVRVRGSSETARREARERFVAPLAAHLDVAGLGHVSEIADADGPHAPRGCPFQAWSMGELLRLDRVTLASGSR